MSISHTTPTAWRKSSYSGARDQNCVEVGNLPGGAAVRDTQHRGAGYLEFDASEWGALLDTVRTVGE
ncbi:DUF397 domain-containing protein [Nocardiopsis sp. ATB16-24]|uniref:DUF397 domain-containing protein n=1 Tax=Nocardiopsis sp. ATB16-24 TaxID=3019555 RepID=UPI00255339A5|nr:DUF397 domain-containing protein [Nocardiopsis sp. ATB16-24]